MESFFFLFLPTHVNKPLAASEVIQNLYLLISEG